MKVGLYVVLTAGLLAGSVSVVNATIFTGSATGSWGTVNSVGVNPPDLFDIENNDDGALLTDSALFWWGDPLTGTQWDSGSTRNEFIFNGIGSDGNLGVMDTAWNAPFLLADFWYTNGEAYYAEGVLGVELDIDFFIQETGDTFTLTNSFDITNTVNDPGPVDDIVTLNGTATSKTFFYDSRAYRLDILGFSTNLGQTIATDFSSPENSTNYAGLYGQITEVPVPEPATIMLFGTGLAGLLFGRRNKKNKV